MLVFSVDGRDLGEELVMSGPGEVVASCQATSPFPLKRLEVIFNGEVMASRAARESDETAIDLQTQVDLPVSGWLALRAYGEGHPDAGPRPFAHTSPIYVRVADHPMPVKEHARYFIRWIDRLWRDVKARDRILPSRFDHVKSQMDRARAVYRALEER